MQPSEFRKRFSDLARPSDDLMRSRRVQVKVVVIILGELFWLTTLRTVRHRVCHKEREIFGISSKSVFVKGALHFDLVLKNVNEL